MIYGALSCYSNTSMSMFGRSIDAQNDLISTKSNMEMMEGGHLGWEKSRMPSSGVRGDDAILGR
jgi:hypothetical protein